MANLFGLGFPLPEIAAEAADTLTPEQLQAVAGGLTGQAVDPAVGNAIADNRVASAVADYENNLALAKQMGAGSFLSPIEATDAAQLMMDPKHVVPTFRPGPDYEINEKAKSGKGSTDDLPPQRSEQANQPFGDMAGMLDGDFEQSQSVSTSNPRANRAIDQTRKLFQEYGKLREDVAISEFRSQRERNREMRNEFEGYMKGQPEFQRKIQGLGEKGAVAFESHLEEQKKLTEDLHIAEQNVRTPQQLLAEMSPMQKIGLAIMSFGTGFRGDPAGAMKMVNQMLDRESMARERAVARAEGKLERSDKAWSKISKRYQTEEARAIAWRNYQRGEMLDVIDMRARLPMDESEAQGIARVKAQLLQDQARESMQLAEMEVRAGNKVTTTTVRQKGMSPEQKMQIMQQLQGGGMSKASSQKVVDLESDNRAFHSSLDHLEQLLEEASVAPDVSKFVSTNSDRFAGAASIAAAQFAKATGQDRLSDHDMKIYKAALTGGSGLMALIKSKADIRKTLEAHRRLADESTTSRMKALSQSPAAIIQQRLGGQPRTTPQ